jgi:hypothetical protein
MQQSSARTEMKGDSVPFWPRLPVQAGSNCGVGKTMGCDRRAEMGEKGLAEHMLIMPKTRTTQHNDRNLETCSR